MIARSRIYLLLPVLCLCSSCHPRSNNVQFIVPDGFRGAILIYFGTENGETLEVRDGRYVVLVPKTGVLRIRGEGPFFHMSPLTASFSSGEVIPVAWEPDDLSEDAVAFWPGGNKNNVFLYDFIGTKKEHRLWRDTLLGEIKPGGIKQ